MKHNDNNSDLEARYQRFDRLVITLLYLMLVPTILCCVVLVLAENNEIKLVSGALFFVLTAIVLIAARVLAKRRERYLEQLRNERDNIVRSGIWGDVYDEYKHDGFEFNLMFDKLLFSEYENNTIELCLRKNGHEFTIVIDETAVSIIADDETESPAEAEAPLTEFTATEQIYTFINDFISTHS